VPTIRRELQLCAAPAAVWDAIRDVGAVHQRLARGFVTATRLEPSARLVTFANGVQARELIVSLEEAERRLVWAVVGGRATHHNSSFQVLAGAAGGTRLVWITDVLPDEVVAPLTAMIDAGLEAIRRTLDAEQAAGALSHSPAGSRG
jgi:Polyketide cyclase / dehydrase and lipid transport